jgi:hypothetical protein
MCAGLARPQVALCLRFAFCHDSVHGRCGRSDCGVQLPGALGINVESGGNVVERLLALAHGVTGISGLSVVIAAVTFLSVCCCKHTRAIAGFFYWL